MKVLFPVVDSDDNKDMLALNLQKAREVGIFDSETLMCEFMSKSGFGDDMKSFVAVLQEQGVDSIITPQIRPLALQLFIRCNVKVYESEGVNVDENLSLFRCGYLNQYSISDSRNLLRCDGSSCSSCSSTTCG